MENRLLGSAPVSYGVSGSSPSCTFQKTNPNFPLKLSRFYYSPCHGRGTESLGSFRSSSNKKKCHDNLTLRVCITHRPGQQLDNVFLSATSSKCHLGTLQISIFHFQTKGNLMHLENLFSRHYGFAAYENTLFPRMLLCLSFHIVDMCCGCVEPTKKPLTF